MIKKQIDTSNKSTSWQTVKKWYDDAVGTEGHYYHQQIVIPGVLRLLNLKSQENPSVLDLACGQGILGRSLSPVTEYVGLDIAPGLVQSARNYDKHPKHYYSVADVSNKLPINKTDFTHCTVILALQNIEHPNGVIQNASKHLKTGGSLVFVLNHPCFRIPRQSSWKIDEGNKTQYRRLDRYLSPLQIPIKTHPGEGERSSETWSFHHPLSAYTLWLSENNFVITHIEEWCSDKISTGKAAIMENRARQEFPLFMTICAKKI